MQSKVKKGDTVYMRAGKDRGKTGKVLHVSREDRKILVEGINLFKHHTRRKREGEKGSIVTKPTSFPSSRAMVVCGKCGKPTRVGYKLTEAGKSRVCKKCHQEF